MDRIFKTAAKSAAYNFILQVAMRLTSFILNGFILRYLSQDTLGIINVRLMLLYSTTQFLSREAFRRACLTNSKDTRWHQVANLVWLVVPVTLAWGLALRWTWLHLLAQPLDPQYTWGVDAMVIGALVESLAEPFFVYGQTHDLVSLKVVIEALAVLTRAVVMAGLTFSSPDLGIRAFGISMLTSSAIYVSSYYIYFAIQASRNKDIQSIRIFFPTFHSQLPLLDWARVGLTWSFFKQTFIKQLLTEGEKYVMTIFNILSFAEQGVYEVVNNLGSVAARFLLLPIEESSYIMFGNLIQRDKAPQDQDKNSLEYCGNLLRHLTQLVLLGGLLVLVFGQAYARLLLHMYGGLGLSQGAGPTLLQCHCLYFLFIAVNGVTEAFVFAAMNKDQLERYNRKMVVLSALFVGASIMLTSLLGSKGFIFANCFNMAIRIIHSLYFIRNYFKGLSFDGRSFLLAVLPHKSTVLLLLVSLVLTQLSQWRFPSLQLAQQGSHVVLGALCFLATLAVIYCKESSPSFLMRELRPSSHLKKS